MMSRNEINEISRDHITLGGVEMKVEWSMSYSGKSCYAFIEMQGERFRLALCGRDHGEIFEAAVKAAKQGATSQVDGELLGAALGEAKPMAVKAAKAEKVADPAKQRHGEVPEKTFIGTSIEGPGWTILFDGEAGKTRVIFPKKPSAKVIEAVKAAGFWWSPSMKSWNKGLTFKAYRAAEKLHGTLHGLTA